MWSLWVYIQLKILMPMIGLLQISIVVITSLLFVQDYPKHAKISDGQSFDFVIVGGGSAGCVVANRLSEIGNWTILIIEAGDYPPYVSEIPGLSVLLGSNLPDWDYRANDGFSGNAQNKKKIHTIQGKMLGGSSNLNYMYYVRGNKKNYDDWEAKGNKGWDWKNVAKYFKKSEHLYDAVISKGESSYLHGTSGYLGVTRPLWERETKEFFNVFKELGHNILEDTNGYNQLGYSTPSFTIDTHHRQSASFAYIKPIMKRKNLFLLKNTIARKIVLNEDKKAIAVEIDENSVTKYIYANKEVIVSAGALNSPRLLMLSGIGPKQHLEEIGIPNQVNIPNVGANLQDHMLVPIILSRENGSSRIMDNLKPLFNTYMFPSPTFMGFVALDKKQTIPDYQVTAFPLPVGSLLPALMCIQVFEWNDEICVGIANSTRRETLFSLISFLHPKSRGMVRLKSKNPNEKPIIDTRYLSNYEDLEKFARCIEDFTSVANKKYLENMKIEVVDLNIKQCLDTEFGSQKYWECYILNSVASQFHYSGTCTMGPEGVGVVDERLRVRGVKSLRVVDASIMPSIVSGNTYAPVVMIAEKASDMIKTDNGIRPEKIN